MKKLGHARQPVYPQNPPRQFSCKKDQSEDSLREILGNVVLHNHKVTVRDEKKVKPLTKIKDILDTRIENINDKNNPISTFLVVVTTILMSKWWYNFDV